MTPVAEREYEVLLSRFYERIRKRAEKAIRRLIHREWQARLRQAHASLRGQSFRNIGQRVRRAQELTGLNLDEVSGGTLPLDAVLSISNGNDVKLADYSDDSILARAQILGIGEHVIARCIADARSSVKASNRLLKARAAAERAEKGHALTGADVESFNRRFNRGRRRLKR